MEQTVALEELALKNPSLDFRRTLWQVTSAIKSGADLGNTLENIVQNLSEEHKVAIRRYGSQLNPLAMMYMMLAVIIPSLGITFLIIFSSSLLLIWFNCACFYPTILVNNINFKLFLLPASGRFKI